MMDSVPSKLWQSAETAYELTPTQQAMLIYARYAPQSAAYFEQFCYDYRGSLNVEAFRAAWQRVIVRHPILRTSFHWDEEERPIQKVCAEAELPFVYHDWRSLSDTEQEVNLKQFLAEDCDRRFDLTTPPLIRLAVIHTGEEIFRIVISNHHLILDGWSMGLLRQEVSLIYRHLVAGTEPNLGPAPSFEEYVRWLRSVDSGEAEKFFRGELAGLNLPTVLPLDRAPGTLPTGDEVFKEQEISLSPDLVAKLSACARQHRLTLNTLAQAAWAILLGRYSGSDDVTFGITVSGRPYDLEQNEAIAGLFINTLPLRIRLSRSALTSTAFQQLQTRAVALRTYESIPLPQIHGWSDVPRTLPLFETLLVFENFAGHDSSFDLGGETSLVSSHLSRTNYPLTVMIAPESMNVRIVYHQSRFNDEAIRAILSSLGTIFETFAEGLDSPVGAISVLSNDDRHKLLNEWSRSGEAAADKRPIHRIIEEHAAAIPDAAAVESENEHLTYAQLNARANQLARYLRSRWATESHIMPGQTGDTPLVGICLERSVDMIVALLAVLKAGGAYVPLDPSYPEDRLAFMLHDSQAGIVLTTSNLAEHVPCASDSALILVDQLSTVISRESGANLNTSGRPDDPAYVIYTSGSTGQPKGVMIPHRALTNFALSAAEEFRIASTDRVLQFASLCFDTSVEEIFCTLSRGATLVLRTEAMLSSYETFLQRCAERSITVLDLPTAYWHHLVSAIAADALDIPATLRLVILGGEQVRSDRVETWFRTDGKWVRLVNTYGPTEATVVTTISDLTPGDPVIRIGRPVRGALVYVLDAEGQPAPPGLAGELYIGGEDVALGYLNRPELTAEKFIANPFGDGGRLYRTGDIVRFLPDGSLEFLTRRDRQIKIRGFRVELEEVEQTLRQHPDVSDVIVDLREDADGDKRLVAYVVPRASTDFEAARLITFAKGKLPAHAIPSLFVNLPSLPLLPNGKVDHRALPDPVGVGVQPSDEFIAPRTPTEEMVAAAWRQALKLSHVSAHDNFFELGGHSLLAANVFSILKKQLNVELSLVDMFKCPTVEALAELICARSAEHDENELMSLLEELKDLSDEDAAQLVDASAPTPLKNWPLPV